VDALRRNAVLGTAYITLFLLYGVSISPSRAYSQPVIEWSKTFGYSDDYTGWSVKQTADGGYIIAAETWDFEDDDVNVYLFKIKMEETQTGSEAEIEPETEENGGFVIPGYLPSTIITGLLITATTMWFFKRKQ
jgi:hypothetical protein